LHVSEPFGAPHLQSSTGFLQAAAQATDPLGAPHLQASTFLAPPNGHEPELQQPAKVIMAATSAVSSTIFFIIFLSSF